MVSSVLPCCQQSHNTHSGAHCEPSGRWLTWSVCWSAEQTQSTCSLWSWIAFFGRKKKNGESALGNRGVSSLPPERGVKVVRSVCCGRFWSCCCCCCCCGRCLASSLSSLLSTQPPGILRTHARASNYRLTLQLSFEPYFEDLHSMEESGNWLDSLCIVTTQNFGLSVSERICLVFWPTGAFALLLRVNS